MTQPLILIVDDDKNMRLFLREAIQGWEYASEEAASAEEALMRLEKKSFDLILLDEKLPGRSGVETIPLLREKEPHAIIIMITAYATDETALEALRRGTYDFLSKPLKLTEMEVVLSRALEKKRLQDEILRLREAIKEKETIQGVIGTSKAMQEVFHLVRRVAPTDSTALILGESGTGKEVVANAIHNLSLRKEKPFTKLNCVAIPEGLLESELFGHEKGAFTGALAAKPGKFELAHGGTLFLDEVGDMSTETQAKVLRVLQESEFERVGGTRTIKVDVRLIAATNKELSKEVKEGRFREDLYYRLNVVAIFIPPLRERREDIPALVDFFVQEANRKLAPPLRELSKEALRALMDYAWPGNVRELKNVIERAAILSEDGCIRVENLPPELRTDSSREGKVAPSQPQNSIHLRQSVEETEKGLILAALEKAGWVQTEAARLLHITPKNLWAKIRKYGIPTREKEIKSP